MRTASIATVCLLYMLIVIGASTGLIVYLWLSSEKEQHIIAKTQIRNDYLESQKKNIKNEVSQVVDYINYQKSSADIKLKKKLKSKVDEVFFVANTLYGFGKEKNISEKEIKESIITALRKRRFNNERGYFFIIDFTGKCFFNSAYPEFEGGNIKKFQKNELWARKLLELTEKAKQGKEGFIQYPFYKPGAEKNLKYPKIIYAHGFMPFNWLIGAGGYLDEAEAEIKKEVLEHVKKIRFGENAAGYIFVIDSDGMILANAGGENIAGRKIQNLKNLAGSNVYNKLIKAASAKSQDHYVNYSWRKNGSNLIIPKISFVKALPDWKWIIGAGEYYDDIEKNVAERDRVHVNIQKNYIQKIVFSVILFIFLAIAVAKLYSLRIKDDFNLLISFFKRAENEAIFIDLSKFSFSEFRELSQSVNIMLKKNKQVNDELRKSELMISSVSNPMAIVGRDYKYKKVNNAYLTYFGKDIKEIEGANVSDICGVAFEKKNLKPYLDECFNGRDAQYETWGEFAVGRRYILCKLTPIYSDQGGIVGAVSNLNDITESLKNKELLRLERERFFLMLESIPAFVYLLDSGHKIVYCNENFNETFDLKKTCICSQGAQDEKCKAFNIFNTRENRRWEWTSSAGKTYILQGTYLPEIDGNPMVLILGVDITDRKIIESQLIDAKNVAESANRSKSEFLANMSHEIRTPMNAVLGMTELVLESELNDEQRELLDMVMESGDALLSVINEILDFSRIEKNNCPLRLKDFILPGLLESVIRSFRVTADAKGLKLEYNASPGLPFNVKGDADKLRQILVNLIGNALKFTESGKVVLNVNWESECNDFFTLRFSVEDTGIGIPEEKSASIFDAFIQVDGSSTRSYGGTGLGLAISSRLVSLMGGKIWLESKLGEGSKFHFTVQLEKSQETFNYENVEDKILNLRDLKSAYGAGKILIAEDDLTCRKIIVQQLQSSGYDVVVAENGRDAVEFFKKEKFEAVFMDIQMPEMDGYEAVEEIRDYEHKNGKKKITPVIAITAHAMENERDKCFAAGMNDFISKPAKKSEILLKLSSLLKDNT